MIAVLCKNVRVGGLSFQIGNRLPFSAWGSESGAAEKGLWPVCRLAEGSDFLSGSGVVSDFGQ